MGLSCVNTQLRGNEKYVYENIKNIFGVDYANHLVSKGNINDPINNEVHSVILSGANELVGYYSVLGDMVLMEGTDHKAILARENRRHKDMLLDNAKNFEEFNDIDLNYAGEYSDDNIIVESSGSVYNALMNGSYKAFQEAKAKENDDEFEDVIQEDNTKGSDDKPKEVTPSYNIGINRDPNKLSLPLKGNEELYKHYNLLNKNGKIKTIDPDSDSVKKWYQSLKQSTRHDFMVINTYDGYKIVIVNPNPPILHSFNINKITPIDRYNRAGANVILNKLSKKLDIKYELSNIGSKGEYNPVAKLVSIDINTHTGDTLFHEFLHPVVRLIKNENKSLFDGLKDIIDHSERGKEILAKVKQYYKFEDADDYYEEAIVTLAGEQSFDIYQKIEDKKKTIFDYISNFMVDMFNSLIDDPSKRITKKDLFSIKDIKGLALLMNLENEFDIELQKDLSKSVDVNTQNMHSKDTSVDYIANLKTYKTDKITPGSLSYSGLMSKGYSKKGIPALKLANVGKDDEMYARRAIVSLKKEAIKKSSMQNSIQSDEDFWADYFSDSKRKQAFYSEVQKEVNDYLTVAVPFSPSMLDGSDIGNKIQELKKADKERNHVGDLIDNIASDFFAIVEHKTWVNGLYVNLVDSTDSLLKDGDIVRLYTVNGVENKEYKALVLELYELYKEINNSIKEPHFNPQYKFEVNVDGNLFNGAVDLLVANNYGDAIVIDYKSRNPNSKSQWFSNYGEFYNGELFEQYKSSKYNDVSMQTSYYGMFLANVIGFENITQKAVYVEAVTVNEQDNISFKNPQIKSFNSNSKMVDLIDHKSMLWKALIGGIDNEKFPNEIDKINNHNQLIYSMLSGNKINNFEQIGLYYAVNPETENGIEGFRNEFNKFIPFDSANIEDRLKQLEPVSKMKKKENDNAILKVIEYFNGNPNAFSDNRHKESGVQYMLSGINPLEYDLVRLNSISGFENSEAPVLVAINKITKDRTLLYFSTEQSHPIVHSNGNKTVYGAFISDKAALALSMDKADIASTSLNYQKIELASIAMQMKADNKTNREVHINRLLISNGLNSKNRPYTFDMHEAIHLYKPLIKVIGADKFGGVLQHVNSNDHFFDSFSYNPNFLHNLYSFLLNSSTVNSKDVSDYYNSVVEYEDAKMTKSDVMMHLHTLEDSIKRSFTDIKDLEASREYIAVMNAIKYLHGIESRVIKKEKWMVTKAATIEQNFPEYIRQKMAVIVKNNDQRIKSQYEVFRTEHKRLLRKVAESRNISLGEKWVSPSLIGIYKNMMQNPDFDYKNYSVLMLMKDPDDAKSNLNDDERNYIRFFNKYMKDSLSISGINTETNYVEGFIPAFGSTIQTKRVLLNQRGDVMANRFVNQDQDAQYSDDGTLIEDYYELENTLKEKYHNRVYNNGVNVDGSKREDFDPIDIEVNLEYILDKAYVTAINYEAHNTSLMVAKAVKLSMEYDTAMYGGDKVVKETLDSIDSYMDFAIKGNTSKVGSAALTKSIDKINRSATTLAIAFSTSQMVLDSATFMFGSTATAMSNFLYSNVFGGDTNIPGYFTGESWLKAGKMLMSDKALAKKIMEAYSIDTTDAKRLMSRNDKLSIRGDVSDLGFAVTRAGMLFAHSQLLIAGMIEDGSINAYSIDDNDQLQYDEKKDLRFYDADGKIKDQLFLDAIKKQAIDDDTLGYEITEVDGIKTVVLKRGYTSVEINTIRNRGVSMLGALDKDAYAKWQQNVIFRSMFKFMPWLQAKKDLYFMERHESEILKVWKKRIDEFGNEGYVAEAMVQEGIVQSLFGLYRKFYAHGYKVLINGGIDDVEKKNMAVLASHLSLYAMTAIMYSMLKMTCVDEMEKKIKRAL